MSTTKHATTCKMAFGRKDSTCPRCQELINGASPRNWNSNKREQYSRFLKELKNHDCVACNCGPVCTAFDY